MGLGPPWGGSSGPGAPFREFARNRREKVCNPAVLGGKVYLKHIFFGVDIVSVHLHTSWEHPRITLRSPVKAG